MQVLGSYGKARNYIEKHYQESDEAKIHRRKLNPGPTITISRETGVGAVAICEKLTEYFHKYALPDYDDWTYFDRELIEKVMEDHHLPAHFKKLLSEEAPPKIDAWFGEILGITPSKISLLHKKRQTILKLAEFGNVIIVGQGSSIITSQLSTSFHVRLVAPFNFRVENAMQLYNVDRKQATDFILKEDESRKDFIHKYFHKNIEDPHLYHVVINTSYLKFENIAEMIGQCIIRKFPKYFNTQYLEQINE
jgi:hypothetical protein